MGFNKGMVFVKKFIVFTLIYSAFFSFVYAESEKPKYKYTKTAMPTNTKDLIEDVKKKIQQNPSDVRGYMFLGLTYERDGQIDNAMNTYRKATQIDPKYVSAYDALGMILAKKGMAKEALVEFEKARKLDPGNWEVLSNIASTHVLLKSYDKAIEIYKQAIDANPKEIKTKIRLAQCYMTAEKYEDAISAYEEILKERPDLTQFDQNLDQLYKKVGRERKSGAVYELKKNIEKQGYHANVQQTGNVVIVAPTYYEDGKAPISDIEKIVFAEYKDKVDKTIASMGSEDEKRKARDEIATEIAKKYNMTLKNFIYMTLKIMNSEVTPDSYVAPSEKPITMKDVTKDKYEAMTPGERTSVVKGWDAKTDFEKLQQKALMSEADKDYKTAAILYKEILESKDIQNNSVPAMHCALQRCYEQLGDLINEKTELSWININILLPDGRYNSMAKFFTNAVITHLKERMMKYDIK